MEIKPIGIYKGSSPAEEETTDDRDLHTDDRDLQDESSGLI